MLILRRTAERSRSTQAEAQEEQNILCSACASIILCAYLTMKRGYSLLTSQAAHQAGAYLRFLWHEATCTNSTPP